MADGIKPKEAASLLLKEQEALKRKVKAGRVLNASERAILSQIASTSEGTSAPETWAKNKVELASALGVNRKTVDRWFEEPDHPEAISNGRYNIAEWKTWAEAHGKKLGDPAPSQAALKARQLLLQNQLLQDKIDVNRRKLVQVDDVLKMGAGLAAAVRKVAATLPSMAQSLVGCELHEIEKLLTQKEDEIVDQLLSLKDEIADLQEQEVPALQEED